MANDGLVTDPELFPCWDPAVTSFPPLPVVSPGPKYFFEGKNGMLLLLAFQRAIARVCIVNKNEWLQTTKISYDGPAETPLWRHSLLSSLVDLRTQIFLWGQKWNALVTSFPTRCRLCLCDQKKLLYQKNAILWLVHISHVAPKWGLAVTSFSLSKYFRHRKPDGNHVANCQAFQHNIACIIARNFSGYRSNFWYLFFEARLVEGPKQDWQ